MRTSIDRTAPSPGSSHHGSHHGNISASILLRLLARHAAVAGKRPVVSQRQHVVLAVLGQHQSGTASAGNSRHRHPSALAAVLCATPETSTTTAPPPAPSKDLGYAKDLHAHFVVEDKQLGKGGNGTVMLVTHRESGQQFACKKVPKVLELGPGVTERKRANHLDSLKREVGVLQKLKGCLNVVELHDVFEDDAHVYMVMENCEGGELHDRIGGAHYSERTVASFMRGVLRTLAVMHSHHILHRDIKPSNFMLLNTSERAPLKAIDFGLAMPFEPGALPLSDLGLEGTPWYMAPEVLSSQATPAADVWAAGVMAHQLLTGHLPFDDKRNPHSPSINAIWKSVLTDPLDFSCSWWADISEEGKDFVRLLLERDPSRRPTAKQALEHPWLRGNSKERSTGKSLDRSVVQRIQRFSQAGLFKRIVLQAITEDLLHSTTDSDAEGGTGSGSRPGFRGPAVIDCPTALEPLYKRLNLEEGESVTVEQLAGKLQAMGYKLEPSEMTRLMEQLDLGGLGAVDRAVFAASQLDWREVQRSEQWMELAQRAFSSLDVDKDGLLDAQDIAAALAAKVPRHEMAAIITQAIQDATGTSSLPGPSPSPSPSPAPGAGSHHASSHATSAFAAAAAAAGNPHTHSAFLDAAAAAAAALGAAGPFAAFDAVAQGGGADADCPFLGGVDGGVDGGVAGGMNPNPLGSMDLSYLPGGSIDFPHFVELLRMGSLDSLDQYDPRFGSDGDSTHHSRQGTAPRGTGAGAAAVAADRLNSMLARATVEGSVSPGAGAGSFFRFDVGTPPHAGASAPKAAGAAAAGAAAPGGAGAFFRFDFSKEEDKKQQARAAAAAAAATAAAAAAAAGPSPASFFRFSIDDHAAATAAAHPELVTPPSPSPPSPSPSPGAVEGSARGGASRLGGVVNDGRHHGSSLYLNQVLGGRGGAAPAPAMALAGGLAVGVARRLEPVAE